MDGWLRETLYAPGTSPEEISCRARMRKDPNSPGAIAYRQSMENEDTDDREDPNTIKTQQEYRDYGCTRNR